jgi:2-keto-3-deoxy-L-arabinonate dehydratase
MKSIAGIVPIAVTPFLEDGRIDIEGQRRVIRFLIDSGAHGIGLFGNASEGYTLTDDERKTLMKAIVEENAGRVPLIASSGHTGTDAAVSMSRELESMGADALMVLPPYYLKPDGEGVVHYYASISKAVRIPIMVQDAPLLTQVPMGPDLLARMGRDIDHVSLVKVEAPPTPSKISKLKQLAGDSLVLFGGLNGHFLLEELSRGAVGTMPGSDLTDGFVRIWNAWQAGDKAKASAEFARYLPLIRYELQPGMGVAVMKQNLTDAGIMGCARVRHPTKGLDAIDIAEVRDLRAPLDLFAFRWAGAKA